jgi:hypothetical protein
MSAKFLSNQLLNSSRFAVGKVKGEEEQAETPLAPPAEINPDVKLEPPAVATPELSNESQQEPNATPPIESIESKAGDAPEHLDNILRREHSDIRRSAVSERITETVQSRRETLERLRETSCEIRQRAETLDAYRKLFDSTAANIAEFDPEITEENLGTIRRAIENARLEIARFERDVMKRQSNTAKTDKLTLSIADIPPGKLLKIGLALTWPVVLALIAAAVAGIVVLFNLFSVN